jgi:hypothetical protein
MSGSKTQRNSYYDASEHDLGLGYRVRSVGDDVTVSNWTGEELQAMAADGDYEVL